MRVELLMDQPPTTQAHEDLDWPIFYQEPHNHNFKPHVDVSDNDLSTLTYAVLSDVEAHWLSAESFSPPNDVCILKKKKRTRIILLESTLIP